MARLLFRERSSPVEVRPGQTPAHSQPLIPYTTTRDTIATLAVMVARSTCSGGTVVASPQIQ